jgi:glucose dehydrogenase
MDTATFMVSTISGLNLGIAGIMGINIGMSISSSTILFIIVGVIYLASGKYLYKRWNESGKKIF